MGRQWLRIAGAVTIALLALTCLALFFGYGRVGEWVVRGKAVPRIESRLGRVVDIESIDVGRGHMVLENVVVRREAADEAPLAVVPRVVVEFDFWASLRGHVDVASVVIENPQIVAIRGDGDNVSDLVDRLRSRNAPPAAGDGRASVRPREVRVVSGVAHVSDTRRGVHMEIDSFSLKAVRGQSVDVALGPALVTTELGATLAADALAVTFDVADPVNSAVVEVTGGRLSVDSPGQGGPAATADADIRRGLSLTAISGTIARGEKPGHLFVDLAGSYGGATEPLWKATGSVDPRQRQGVLDIEAKEFALGRLRSVLAGSVVQDYENTTVGAALHLELIDQRVTVDGSLTFEGLTIYHGMLAEKPLQDLSFSSKLKADIDLKERKLTLEGASLSLGKTTFEVSGTAQLAGGTPRDGSEARAEPVLSARLIVPTLSCQEFLDSLPGGFLPYLQGLTLRGDFHADVEVAVDWADLDATVLDGSVGLRNCKVRKAPPDVDVMRFDEPFEHWVEVEDGQWVSFVVGPSNPDYVPLDDISQHLINAFMTTEDSAFYRHKGFIVREFRTAFIKDLEAGYFKYGASSITMQTVKNIILYREKTLSRKVQELFFTWYLETKLSKDRIMEIYVNAIEYGPGLYGIGPAARLYFDKHPRDLTPVEAAFFSSILPSPKTRYMQWCDGELTRWTTGKIQRILQLMHKRERLTDDEYMLASVTPLEFAVSDDVSPRECKQRARRFAEQSGSSAKNPRKK